MPRYRWLPYPTSLSFHSIQFYVYPFVLFAGFFTSLFIILRERNHSSLNYGIFLVSLIGILFLNQARVRSDSIHLLPAVLVCAIAGPTLFYALYKSSNNTTKIQLSKLGSYLILAMIIIPLSGPIYRKFNSINSSYFFLPKISYRSGYAGISADLQDLVLYLRNCTGKKDAIYVGVDNHDQFIVNDIIVYFLAERPCATKYHELHPGVTNAPNIQKEIIQDIENARARVIVLAPRYWYEPNETKVDSKTDCLDNYIREKYEFTQRFGVYEVWTRKLSNPVAQQSAALTAIPLHSGR
ncbi:MAG TPA: hypothetical protein ENL10_00055 [Candidatus Cloacimonetes bacterium]|nr:hypothetical protein [Candidatus Cloacimonadota bacterium]